MQEDLWIESKSLTGAQSKGLRPVLREADSAKTLS